VEDNYLLMRLADALGSDAPKYMRDIELGRGDDWLRTDEKAPNSEGCERLGMTEIDPAVVGARIETGEVKLVYMLEDDPVAAGILSADDLATVAVILHPHNTTNETLPVADVVLPAATVVETVGTYVNMDGHAQRVRPAKAIRGINRTLVMEMGQSRADRHGTPFDKWHDESNLVDCQPGWVSLPEVASRMDIPLDYKGPRQIMTEISASMDAFAGATYESMGLEGVRLVEIGATV
ncbi:MAG: molybdopterin-dependent oxidoreductase, partial [Rhodothermales bacterium]|nr:molybdopterin-dependent oxidoreductase [Rhodothermales bacterium]